MEKRPQIEIEADSLDKLLEMLAAAGLALSVAIPVFTFSSLPETIPINFGPDGRANGFSGKAAIFVLPAVAAMIYFTFGLAKSHYRSANYLVKITEENAEDQYRILLRMVQFMKAATTLFMAFFAWRIIQVSNNEAE